MDDGGNVSKGLKLATNNYRYEETDRKKEKKYIFFFFDWLNYCETNII